MLALRAEGWHCRGTGRWSSATARNAEFVCTDSTGHKARRPRVGHGHSTVVSFVEEGSLALFVRVYDCHRVLHQPETHAAARLAPKVVASLKPLEPMGK
jgi:hypothetical protein